MERRHAGITVFAPPGFSGHSGRSGAGRGGEPPGGRRAAAQDSGQELSANKSPLSTTEPPTPYEDVTTYNNFYEFGTDKGDPARERRHAQDRARGR